MRRVSDKKEFDAWLTENRDHIKQITVSNPNFSSLTDVFSTPELGSIKAGLFLSNPETQQELLEFTVELDDNRKHMKRVWLGEFVGQEDFEAAVEKHVGRVDNRYGPVIKSVRELRRAYILSDTDKS